VEYMKSTLTKLFRRNRNTPDITVRETNKALKGFAKEYTIYNEQGTVDENIFLDMVKPPAAEKYPEKSSLCSLLCNGTSWKN